MKLFYLLEIAYFELQRWEKHLQNN